MDKGRWLLKLAAAVLLLVAMASCASAVEPGPRAWIDFPRDGASGPPGEPVNVICHASASKGVAEVLLSVNGAEYGRSPLDEPGAAFGKCGEGFVRCAYAASFEQIEMALAGMKRFIGRL